jgi:hypothetical protein
MRPATCSVKAMAPAGFYAALDKAFTAIQPRSVRTLVVKRIAFGLTITAGPLDSSLDLEAALDGPLDVITSSALLDLVSEAWLERFVVEIVARSLPLYAALSYDGRAGRPRQSDAR